LRVRTHSPLDRPIAWFWASRGDARLPLSLGLLLFAVGAFFCTYLTPGWQAADFRLALVTIGFGQGLFLVPTVFYATRDVAPQQGPTAAALFASPPTSPPPSYFPPMTPGT